MQIYTLATAYVVAILCITRIAAIVAGLTLTAYAEVIEMRTQLCPAVVAFSPIAIVNIFFILFDNFIYIPVLRKRHDFPSAPNLLHREVSVSVAFHGQHGGHTHR